MKHITKRSHKANHYVKRYVGESLECRLLLSAVAFQPAVQYATGTTPESVGVGDLGNGHPDLVLLNANDDTMGVLLGNGDGTFKSQQTYAVGPAAQAFTLADLGNGHPDIIVADAGGDTVGVLLGNGDGTFQAQSSYATGSDPVSLAVADLGNGHPDIVVANAIDNSVSVLLGNGNGTFAAQATFAVNASPVFLVEADLGNGHPDIITANSDGTLSVLLGNGDGTFLPQETYVASTSTDAGIVYPVSFPTVADLGNGHPDLVVLNGVDNTVSVLLGNGDGSFQSRQTYATGNLPTAIVVADLGNGHPDIAVTNQYDSNVSVLLGNGDGSFQNQQTYAAGSSPALVAVAEFRNGRPDLVAANDNSFPYPSGAPSLTVLLGTGDGAFANSSTFAISALPTSLVVADLGNGLPDIITTNADNTVNVLIASAMAPSTTTLSSSANPSVAGALVTFTATVSGFGPAPTGTVTFFDAMQALGSAPLTNGTATLSAPSLPVRSNNIRVEYNGDANYDASTSLPMIQTVWTVAPTLKSSAVSVIGGKPLNLRESLILTAGHLAARGAVSATIFLSPDESTGDSVFTLASVTERVALRPGQHTSLGLSLPASIPATLAGYLNPDGTAGSTSYHVLIRLADTLGTLAVMDSGQTLSVFPASVLFAASFAKVPDLAPPGQKFPVSFFVTNTKISTIPADGLLQYNIEASPDGYSNDATFLTAGTQRIYLRRGRTLKITVDLTLTSSSYLILTLDPNFSIPGDIDLGAGDNTVQTSHPIWPRELKAGTIESVAKCCTIARGVVQPF